MIWSARSVSFKHCPCRVLRIQLYQFLSSINARIITNDEWPGNISTTWSQSQLNDVYVHTQESIKSCTRKAHCLVIYLCIVYIKFRNSFHTQNLTTRSVWRMHSPSNHCKPCYHKINYLTAYCCVSWLCCSNSGRKVDTGTFTASQLRST